MSSNKEKAVLLTVIDKYKDMPYLWKKDHNDYLKKDVRAKGFRLLLETYKNFDEKATVKNLKKKIENLRTTYAKELKKVLASEQAGAGPDEVYVPTLWYFNALSFLGKRTESCRTVTNSLEDENLVSDDDNVSIAASYNSQKRRRMESPIEKQGRTIETSEKIVANLSQNDERCEIFARFIGYQMKDLNENQLVICQKLISDAIFYAKLGKLNENSYIVNPSNEPTFQQHNCHSSSPSATRSSPSPHTSFAPSYHTQLVSQQLQTPKPSNKVLIHQPSPNPHRSLQQPSPYRQPIPSPSHPKSPYHNHPAPSKSNVQDQSHLTHHHISQPSPQVHLEDSVDPADEFSHAENKNQLHSSEFHYELPFCKVKLEPTP